MTNLVKELNPRCWRTAHTQNRYQADREQLLQNDSCPLCDTESLVEFTHWRIIANKYPYDAVATVHTMIIPKEHLVESQLSPAAWAELKQLRHEVLNKDYSYVIETPPGSKSIPGHYHLHLIDPKRID